MESLSTNELLQRVGVYFRFEKFHRTPVQGREGSEGRVVREKMEVREGTSDGVCVCVCVKGKISTRTVTGLHGMKIDIRHHKISTKHTLTLSHTTYREGLTYKSLQYHPHLVPLTVLDV